MPTPLTTLLSPEEYAALSEEAIRRGYYRNDRRVLKPGMAYLAPWIFDPTGERQRSGKIVMVKDRHAGNADYLSSFYWQDYSHRRAPLVVVCPNGKLWEIDRTASNGPGWKVTGEWPRLTAMPSIVVPGYHGWLKDGVFTDDIEGRGPCGIVTPYDREPHDPFPA